MEQIGVDESGKGDYFGYLVTAAVLVDDTTDALLKKNSSKRFKAHERRGSKGLRDAN